MAEEIRIHDRVKVFLDKKGWCQGKVCKIDPYSQHRSFYWVELDAEAQAIAGTRMISVFNPKNIQKSE